MQRQGGQGRAGPPKVVGLKRGEDPHELLVSVSTTKESFSSRWRARARNGVYYSRYKKDYSANPPASLWPCPHASLLGTVTIKGMVAVNDKT